MRAVDQYEDYLSLSPQGRYAGQVHIRLASVYASLNRCEEAKRHDEIALRDPSVDDASKLQAQAGLMDCPDYFPLGAVQKWVYGDSATRGRNMGLDWSVESSSAAVAHIQSALYAGKSLVKKNAVAYEKKDWAIWEKDGATLIPILRYPFSPGRQWSVRSPSGNYIYRIESDSTRVQVAAGVFENCLKVREINEKFPNTWEYIYYAPSVGQIKTSVGGPGFENPNTELIRYETANARTP